MKGKYKNFNSYCHGCDREFVQNGRKCSVCGNKTEVKIKKPKDKELKEKLDKEY